MSQLVYDWKGYIWFILAVIYSPCQGCLLLLLASLYISPPSVGMPSRASHSPSGVEHCAPPEELSIALFHGAIELSLAWDARA